MPRPAACSALLLLVGCSTVSAIRQGSAPPRADSCEIAVRTEPVDVMQRRYEMVGLVTVTFRQLDTLTETERAQVRTEACRMGGTAVTVNAATSGPLQFGGNVQFAVWSPRTRRSKSPQHL